MATETSPNSATFTCAVCQEDRIYTPGAIDKVKLNCKHIFDQECIASWLRMDKNSCPYCRAVVPPQGVPLTGTQKIRYVYGAIKSQKMLLTITAILMACTAFCVGYGISLGGVGLLIAGGFLGIMWLVALAFVLASVYDIYLERVEQHGRVRQYSAQFT
jgi:hypothetical protein